MLWGGGGGHIAVLVAAGLVVGADGHEAGVLAAGPGIGLQRHFVEPRDLRQLSCQVLRRAAEQLPLLAWQVLQS